MKSQYKAKRQGTRSSKYGLLLLFLICTITVLSIEPFNPGMVEAANIYVTPNTSAPQGNGSQSSPYNSIALALNASQAGDVVNLLPGIYNYPVIFPKGGTESNPITLKPSGAALSAIIDCGNANVNCVSANFSNIVIDSLEVRNANYSGIKVDGDDNGSLDSQSYGNYGNYGQRLIRVNGANNVTIQNCFVHNIGFDGIKIGHVNNIKILHNEISQTATLGQQQGIDVVGGYGVVIHGNYIHDDNNPSSMDIGVFCKGGSENVLIENNTVRNITSPNAGIEMGGDTEWYNTRYTPANLPGLNNRILSQTNENNEIDSQATYQPRYMAEARHVVVRGNLIITADPALSFRNVYDAKAYNNTIINSGWSQSWVKLWSDGNNYHPCEQVRLYNNLFFNNSVSLASRGIYQDKSIGTIYPSNRNGFASNKNLFWNMGSAPTVNLTGVDGDSIFADPLLNSGHRTTPSSPAINVGTNLLSLGILEASDSFIDMDGTQRPLGGEYDIGAFEYVGNQPGSVTGLRLLTP
ncbi:MAG: right-handed parallel beta-helix repeat-containing protein [Anaerolineaceae bacterium]